MKWRVFAGVLPAVLIAIAGCGSKSEQPASTPAASGGSSGTGVAAVSKYDAGPRAGESAFEADDAAEGEKLFQSKGCSACHTFGKKMSGPDLQGVSMRRTKEWMKNQILHPEIMTKQDPISHDLFAKFSLQMPNQGLNEEQAEKVIEFLKKKDHDAGVTTPAK
jgi:mono/diheme cytochrome c family protein